MPPEPFAEAGADYIEQLLQAAISAPAAAGDPASGRIVARLMLVLMAKGEGSRLDPYLSCRRGRPSVYDVSSGGAEDPGRRVCDLSADDAVRTAARLAAQHNRAEVVARDDSGERRRVLTIEGATVTYLFAPEDPGDHVVGESSAPGPSPSAAGWSELTARLDSLPTADQVVGALRELLGAMTVQIDATALEEIVVAAVEEMSHTVGGPARDTTRIGEEASAAALERLARAVDALAFRMPTASEIADRLALRLSTGTGETPFALDDEDVADDPAEGPGRWSEHDGSPAYPSVALRRPLDPAAEDALAAGDRSGAGSPLAEAAPARRGPASGRVVATGPRAKP